MVKRIKEIIITSPSRLHLGFYGFDAHHGYKYGSMGLAINAHKTIISVKHSQNMVSDLPKKYTLPLTKYLKLKGVKNRFEIKTLQKPPSHVGLGSGTQLSLCIGMAICKLFQLNLETNDIANLYNRGQRSGTGISIFNQGGFVVDACKKDRLIPRVMFKSKFPKDWRIILLNDIKLKGTSGKRENKFFSKSLLTNHKKLELSHILLRGILPSIVYEDFQSFSKNLTEFQRNTAEFYREKQKGIFLSPEISNIIEYVKNYDNLGIGQSSWGPMSYIFVESKLHAKELLSIIQNKFNVYNNVQLNIVSPWNSGYKISYK
tara:strand:- start:813 stop:1763 length:951 start_codon:yes stop_codon:yes gene_type:complete